MIDKVKDQERSTDNMRIWKYACETDPQHTKQVNLRGGLTSVDPQHSLELATELWGPYGEKWGMRDATYTVIEPTESVPTILFQATFFYPGGSFPIANDSPYKPNDDFAKKLMTGARSKALSLLGFHADIYLGMYDDDEYVQRQRAKRADKTALLEKMRHALKYSRGKKLEDAWERICLSRSNDTLTASEFESLRDLYCEIREAFGVKTRSVLKATLEGNFNIDNEPHQLHLIEWATGEKFDSLQEIPGDKAEEVTAELDRILQEQFGGDHEAMTVKAGEDFNG